MAYDQRLLDAITGSDIRIWKHGEFPMPDWVTPLMASGIEANGTFAMDTDLGRARVHIGHVIIEKAGKAWVCQTDEVVLFVEHLRSAIDAPITNIGPGKVHQFGSTKKEKTKPKQIGGSSRPPSFPKISGTMPTIEWIHVQDLSVDASYQRSTDNVSSRRLISSIANRFDWRLRCRPK
ncbi:hypothetical protein [Asticcacaulis solisilvae]|uniref:hypothetical protein n=1 Tax=Asticcacaulis solisilvae TaxID=1217274 RepID=UPI003FD7FF9F